MGAACFRGQVSNKGHCNSTSYTHIAPDGENPDGVIRRYELLGRRPDPLVGAVRSGCPTQDYTGWCSDSVHTVCQIFGTRPFECFWMMNYNARTAGIEDWLDFLHTPGNYFVTTVDAQIKYRASEDALCICITRASEIRSHYERLGSWALSIGFEGVDRATLTRSAYVANAILGHDHELQTARSYITTHGKVPTHFDEWVKTLEFLGRM